MSIARGFGQGSRTEKQSKCQECRQPLEQWEAGFCEGCGMTRKRTAICSECGEKTNVLEHPNYSGDKLCKDCLISWHEAEIDDLESEIRSHREQLETIKKS